MNKNIMGIYQITNKRNGKIYIGSSIDIPKRWKQHIADLKKNKHTNKHLQNSWNKYGEDNFIFDVIEIINDENVLFEEEQKWIDKTKCYDGNIGYNISIDASRPVIKEDYIISHLNCNLVFRNKLDEILAMKLTNNEKLVFYVLRDFIQYPTNCIVIKDKIPSIKELEPIIGLTERSIISALNSLENKNFLKRKQYGHKKAIYLNPEYYASGKDLDIEILQMFDLIECDDGKIEQYINQKTD